MLIPPMPPCRPKQVPHAAAHVVLSPERAGLDPGPRTQAHVTARGEIQKGVGHVGRRVAARQLREAGCRVHVGSSHS